MLLHALKREYFKKLEARCKKPAETKKKDKGKIKGKKKRHEGDTEGEKLGTGKSVRE